MRLRATKLASFHHPQFRLTELYSRAGEVPSFHIAPARTRDARDLITGSVLGTYNSASPAWAVGPDGVLALPAANAPVIEYDPVTRACLGARIWGVVTNLLLRSEELEAAAWGRVDGASVTANQSTGPTGSLTLDRVFGNGSQIGFLFQSFAITLGTAYTFSIFLKKSNSSQVLTLFYGADFNSGGGNPQAIWNLDTGVATFSNNCSGGMIPYPNNIYRCYITVTATTTAGTTAQFLRMSSVSGDVFAGGAQLQTGSTLGPYVPTTTLAASSTADVWSITGADAARIINTAQGTLYADFATGSAVPVNTYPTMLQLQGANRQNEVQIYAATGAVAYLLKTGNVVQAEANLSATTQNGVKSAFRYAENNSRSYANGSPLFLDTVCTMPATDRIFIGSSNGSENFLNGYIREAAILRTGRADANLQVMTQ